MRRKNLRNFATLRSASASPASPNSAHDAARFSSNVSGNRRGAIWSSLTRMDGDISPAGIQDASSGPVPGGWQHPSGTGCADGSDVGTISGPECHRGLAFNRPVADNGYAWWYIDALSNDGQYGLTIIIFVGSVFSPYYAHARRRGRGDPENFCAINVALYNPRAKRWALTERGVGQLARDDSWITIGPSSAYWNADSLTIDISEMTFPLPTKILGQVVIRPHYVLNRSYALDDYGNQLWRPIAPSADIEVDLRQPALRWRGNAYVDMNFGNAPLESAFTSWHWSRAKTHDGTVVFYEVNPLMGSATKQQQRRRQRRLALQFGALGQTSELDPLPSYPLPATLWGIRRRGISSDERPRIITTLEDTPFYARSLMSQRVSGENVTAVHESLSLTRFSKLWVQCLLPFRMPRRA